MVRPAAVITLLLLASCGGSSEIDQAKNRYQFLRANGAPSADICRQARRIASLAADAGEHAEYQQWQATAELDCNESPA